MSNSQLYYVQYLLGQVRHAALRCLLQYAGHISFTHSLLYSQADVLLTRACHSNRYIPFRAKNACLYCACMLITELTAAAVAAAAAVASLSDVAAYVLPFLSRHQTHFVSCLDCWLIQDGPKTDCLCRLKACIHGWRKINLPGLTPASLNQSGPNLADVHRSRSDNVQEILGQNRRL